MDTDNLSRFFDSTRLKNARRKKQLVKKNFTKQLIQLLNKLKNENPLKNKSENEIYQEYIDEKF